MAARRSGARLLQPRELPPGVIDSALVRTEPQLDMQPGSPEWLEARRTGLGGSDIAAALGLSLWMSPYELWLDKIGELPPRPDTEPMRWGRLMEPLILNAYSERTRWKISRPRMMRSERYPWLIANLDGVAMTGRLASARVVEAKNAHSRLGWGEPGTDDVPQQYLLQAQSYLIVTALAEADIVVLFGGNDLQVYTVRADAELQQLIIDGTREFWHRHVQGLLPPPVAGIEDARRRWGKLAAKGVVVATPEDQRMVAQLREARAGIKVLKEDADRLEGALMARLGETGDTLIDPDTKQALVTWKLAAGVARLDLELFRNDHPDLWAKYAIAGDGARRFIVKKEIEA